MQLKLSTYETSKIELPKLGDDVRKNGRRFYVLRTTVCANARIAISAIARDTGLDAVLFFDEIDMVFSR